jgi:hypothetical protein
MQTTPAFSKGLWLGCICVIALGITMSSMTRVFGTTQVADEEPVEQVTFKKLIAQKAVEEYNRWHPNGTLREKDPVVTPILKEYWKLGAVKVSDNNLHDGSWQYRHPWSAVFISYVMMQAGAGNHFPYANNHAKYIVWARENALKDTAATFAAYDVKDQRAAWPEPGDLICMNRKSNCFTLYSINSECISHCDIVTEVNKERGYLVTIGGNVGQTVNKRIVWLDEKGFIDTSRNYQVQDLEEENPEGSQKQIFGVIKVKDR